MTVQAADKALESANTWIRNSRSSQQKKLRTMQVERSVRPDDLRKAGDMMEKIVEKSASEVKKTVETARRMLEGG